MPSPCLLVAGWPWSVGAIVAALAALVAAGLLHVTVTSRSDGDESLRALAAAQRSSALESLKRLAWIAGACGLVGLVVLLSAADSAIDRVAAWGVLIGAGLAFLAGAIGLEVAHAASARAVEGARTSPARGVETAEAGARVTALSAAGLALIGASALWLLAGEPAALFGLALGASAVALFARCGGASLRPAADGAQLLEAHVVAIVATMALAAASLRAAGLRFDEQPGFVVLPLALASAGAVAAIFRRVSVLLYAVLAVALLLLVDLAPLLHLEGDPARSAFGATVGAASALLAGLVAALAAGRTTGHFASGSARALVPIVLIAAAMMVAQAGAGRFGVGLAALGATSVLRIAPWSGLCGAPVPDALADAERGSAAIGRGVAAAAAALTALVLFGLFLDGAASGAIALADPDVAAGLLVGAAFPFAVARAPGTNGADRASTPFALRAMIVAGLVAVAAPLVVGKLNPAALCGLLAGSIACGVLLALIVSDAALDTLIKLTSLVAIVATRR